MFLVVWGFCNLLWLELDLSGLYIAGVVASRAQWRFGIFTVGLQMAIKLDQVYAVFLYQ